MADSLGGGTKKSSANHENLADAVLASGVNLRAEEEALAGNVGISISKRQIEQNTFLNSQQLQWFMNNAMQEQGISTIHLDGEVVNLMSAACEQYMKSIVSDAVILARHRKASAIRVGKSQKTKPQYSSTKSDISKALKELAEKDKEREERRQQRKVQLGLIEQEKKDVDGEDHRQTNVTASLMMGGSKKKKYSWMQTSDTPNSVSSRGDNGIRFREAREEPNIVMRDFLAALENRRMGVRNTILKGYGKLKD